MRIPDDLIGFGIIAVIVALLMFAPITTHSDIHNLNSY